MPTLQAYRQAAAKLLGPYVSGTAGAGSTPTVLQTAQWPFKSTIAQDDLYADYFLYRPSAAVASDAVRVVASYTPSTGQLVPDQQWTTAPWNGVVGEPFELHGIIEPYTALTELINEGLKRCLVVVEVQGVPTQDARRHSLGTVASWTVHPRWVRQVGWLAVNEDRNQIDPFGPDRVVRGEAVADGNVIYLNHPFHTFSPTDTVYVRLVKRAYDHCGPSSSQLGAQPGLGQGGDQDVALPPLDWVAQATLVEAWKRYGHLLAQPGNERVIRDQASSEAIFTSLSQKYFEMPPLTFRPLVVGFGPRWRAWATRIG